MTLALLAVLGLAWWMHKRGGLLPAIKRWGAVAALGLLAVRFLETGNLLAALAAGGGAAAWWFAARQRSGEVATEREARAVLGLDAEADANDIHAAWRRALAVAHPDKGGSVAETTRVTAARDLLLERLARR